MSRISVNKFFQSQYRNTSRSSPSVLCFRKVLVAKKFWIRGKGKYQDVPSNMFRLTVPKKAVGESFNLSLTSCIEKICMRG